MNIGLLKVDSSINIQRTDGRVHAATISSIDAENQVVLVEWFENDETKGKEIDIIDVIKTNPSLFPEDTHHNNNNNNSLYDNNNNEIIENSSKESVKSVKRPVTTASPKEFANNDKQPQKLQKAKQQPLQQIQQGQQRVQIPRQQSQLKQANQPITTRNNRLISMDSENSLADVNGNKRQSSPPLYDANNNGNQDEGKKSSFKKKSNCVKEVERIEQRRNERRAHNLAMKEQYEAVYDTSSPNWEFQAMIKEYRKSMDYKPITWNDAVEDKQICVCLRKRPLNKKEIKRKDIDVLTMPAKDVVVVHEPKTKVDLTKYLDNQSFRFDYAFDENSSNETIYKYTAAPLVECTFHGGMATCFAYGQTGSGKTHTMGGDFTGLKGKQDCSKGIYVLAATDVFRLLNTKYKKLNLSVGASFFEIYSGKVFDLLDDKKKLQVMEDGKQQVQIVGLKEEAIDQPEEVLKHIQHGNSVRTSGQTSANNHSSRSHAVFQIILRKRTTGKLHGKFSLIDLAGNERGADTMESERSIRMEGAEINKSLLALKECIRALGRSGAAHLPFRASKLTHVLRDSFIGEKSRTCMIAMVSPGMSCCEHTLNTLRYADRVKELDASASNDTNKSTPTSLQQPNPPILDEPLSSDDQSPMHPSPPPSALQDSLHEDLKSQKSDLAILKNSNCEELTDDLYKFHEAVDRMREMEEEVLEQHKEIAAKALIWVRNDRKLMSMTDDAKYDVEVYANELNALLEEKIESLQSLKSKVQSLKDEIATEQQLSKNIKH